MKLCVCVSSIYGIAIKQKEKYNCFVKILMQANDDKPLSASFQVGYIEWLDQVECQTEDLETQEYCSKVKITVPHSMWNTEETESTQFIQVDTAHCQSVSAHSCESETRIYFSLCDVTVIGYRRELSRPFNDAAVLS